jgi:hypothetical protein
LDSQNLPDQLQHHPARHPANHRQVSDERCQLGTEVTRRFLRDRRLRRFAAFRTKCALALVLGDMRFDGRQFGHLMPSRVTFDSGLRTAAGEPVVAVTAAGREYLDHFIDSFGRYELAPASTMARLASRFPAALFPLAASLTLFARQSI